MKKAFIPQALRPEVIGAKFNATNPKYALQAIIEISDLNQILNLGTRKKIFTQVLKNLPEDEDEECFKPLKTVQLLFKDIIL
jgi:hypothetical protein